MFKFWTKSKPTNRTEGPTQKVGSPYASDNPDSSLRLLDGKVWTSLQHLMTLRFSANLLSLPSAKRGFRQQTGNHFSRFKGRGMEFAEVRVYQPGDDIRAIDWRVTARRQTPHTKLFHEERERPVLISCDQSLAQFFGSKSALKSVKAAEAASLLAWTSLNHGDRVGGLVFSDKGHKEIKPARNRKAVTRFIQAISEFNHALLDRTTKLEEDNNPTNKEKPDSQFSLESALQECRRISKPGALNIIISDFSQFTPECIKLLHMIRAHGEIIAIQTFDALERQLPPPGDYPVSDGRKVSQLHTSSPDIRRQFEEQVRSKQQFLKESFNSLQIPFIEIASDEDVVTKIKQTLVAGGMV